MRRDPEKCITSRERSSREYSPTGQHAPLQFNLSATCATCFQPCLKLRWHLLFCISNTSRGCRQWGTSLTTPRSTLSPAHTQEKPLLFHQHFLIRIRDSFVLGAVLHFKVWVILEKSRLGIIGTGAKRGSWGSGAMTFMTYLTNLGPHCFPLTVYIPHCFFWGPLVGERKGSVFLFVRETILLEKPSWKRVDGWRSVYTDGAVTVLLVYMYYCIVE